MNNSTTAGGDPFGGALFGAADTEKTPRFEHHPMSIVEMDEEDDIAASVLSGGIGSSMMMEVDDGADPVDVLADFDKHLTPVDSDFFNAFPDDFDDTDLS